MWARQLVEKSWLDDPEPFIEAFTEAVRQHHPGQIVIDLDATRGYALREWQRNRDRKRDHALGYEYQPGEPTLRRLERQEAEAAAKATSGGGGPPEERWVAPIVSRVRDALERYGVDPSAHSAGLDVNERVAAMAVRGATDEELAAASDQLKGELILCDEEPEADIEMPLAAELAVEEMIDDEIYKRHQERVKLREDKGSA